MIPRRLARGAAPAAFALIGLLSAVAFATAAEARVVTLRWSDSDPASVKGFRVYTRAANGSYGAAAYDGLPTPAGGVYSTSLTVSDTGVTYVVATAYNDAGESALSNELALAPPACGDGHIDPGEQCDDGNTVSGDGCSATCMLEVCGNGILDPGEQCDDGNKVSGDGCSATCKVEVCGNGILDPGEQCDDGNKVGGDGCSATCKLEVCGNGILDPGEQCDDGNKVSGDGCSSTCKFEVCGNGILDPGEQCDDGNKVSGDGCSSTCRREVCGNGILDPGEQCDDGNTVSGDGCSSSCKLEAICGDGVVGPGEQCDDGNRTPGDGCSASCQREVCGNGILDPGEQCDDGNTTSGDGCSATCKLEVCGNGVLDAGEQCDDGNTVGGDGCDAQCRKEVPSALPYHLDVGATAPYTDPTGQVWVPDTPFATGGVVSAMSGIGIGNTTLDTLYLTRRLGDGTNGFHIALPVPGLGPYHVRLHFAELGNGEVTGVGQRVFDVLLEGGIVGLHHLDVYKEAAGQRWAVVKDLYVLVSDGVLDIDFVPQKGQPPMVAAIEVLEGSTPVVAPTLKHCTANGTCQ
jgi:cysteine-rich repeat protein